MLADHTQTIEFMAGPMDGHRVLCSRSAAPPMIAFRSAIHAGESSTVSQLVRLLLFRGHPQPDVIAVYELESLAGENVYRYLRSVLETDATLGPSVELVESQPA
ncbi:hypothetical protein NHH03_08155 [Stieleria sp. TO1_6]|nr:hypothetical protein [Stieleria tagensis]